MYTDNFLNAQNEPSLSLAVMRLIDVIAANPGQIPVYSEIILDRYQCPIEDIHSVLKHF